MAAVLTPAEHKVEAPVVGVNQRVFVPIAVPSHGYRQVTGTNPDQGQKSVAQRAQSVHASDRSSVHSDFAACRCKSGSNISVSVGP